MDIQSSSKGIYNGWHYRFVGIVVALLAVLQILAHMTLKYTVATSLPLAVVVVSYIVAPRVKERRLANTIAGVLGIFVIDLLLEVFWEHAQSPSMANFLELNGFALVMGIVLAFLYLKLTQWSEKKRAELDAKRRPTATSSSSDTTRPITRNTGKYKNKKKKKR